MGRGRGGTSVPADWRADRYRLRLNRKRGWAEAQLVRWVGGQALTMIGKCRHVAVR